MILIPSKYLVKVALSDKSYLILYHSLFGGAVRVKQGVWDLIQMFKVGRDFPQSFSKKELSVYRNTILKLKKHYFLVERGTDERSVLEKGLEKIHKKHERKLSAGNYIKALRLEMASYCNFRCQHCFATKIYKWKKGAKMSFSTAKLAVDGFIGILEKAGKKKGLITFWGGEPLLNWKVIKRIVEYVDTVTKKSAISIEFDICTNGSLLNEQILKFMKLHRIDAIVSLDGFEKENDRFRKTIKGEGTFKKITKALAGLSRYRIFCGVELCLNDYNFNSVERVMDFVYSKYKLGIFVVSLMTHQKSVTNFDHHSNQEKVKRFVEIYDYAVKKGFRISMPQMIWSLLRRATKFALPNEPICQGLGYFLYVNPSGLVYNCHKNTLPIGTVEDIEKIPHGKNYKHVATRGLLKIKGCRGCEIEGFCGGGCAGIAQFYSGDIYDTSHPLFRSFYCDFYRRLFKEMLKYNLERENSRK